MPRLRAFVFVLSVTSAAAVYAQQPGAPYDLIIRHGRIIDGTGSPWYPGDIAVRDGRIAAIGDLAQDSGVQVIDARGMVVAPGFIDMLGQSELTILIDPRVPSKVFQGITTEITGEGESIAPIDSAIVRENASVYRHYGVDVDWHTLAEYFARLQQQGMGINLGTYVGATSVREMVLGYGDAQPTAEQLHQMQDLVGAAMREGALGISTALEYPPAPYARTDELIALARTASQYGGIYATHMRNEGDAEIAALDETFRIAREARIPVEIFHFKTSGRRNFGSMPRLVARVDSARRAGLDITADTYAYTAWMNGLAAFVPPWAQDGGTARLLERLQDRATRARIRRDMLTPSTTWDNEWQEITGPHDVLVGVVLNPELRRLQGKRLDEIAAGWHEDAISALFDLLVKDSARTSVAVFGMAERDVALALRQPWVSVGTDYAGSSTTGILGADRPHPRAYGTFPRILRKYVREEHLLTLPEAIHKFTAVAAQRERLRDRGVIQRGMWADLVVFDPHSIADRATYDDPNQFSVGMWYVLVNGVPVIADKKLTGALPGRVLYGPGYDSGAAGPASLVAQATRDSIARHLIALEQQWNDAILHNDRPAAAAFMADEWTEITSDGSVLTRAEDLDELVGGYHATALRLSDIAVHIYGDAAVVSGISEERSSYRGKDTSGRFRWMDVWVRRAGRWECVASTVWALGALAEGRQVAVTVDDLPYARGDSGALSPSDATIAAEVNQKLLSALRQHHVPVTGFVIQQGVEELGGAAATRILTDWTSGAFDLGNHTYSHPDINGLSLDEIEGEISRGEASIVPLMRQAGKRPRFFRFPMNHTGDTRERHDQVASFLSQRGYRLAPCTIDNSDYLFNQAYARMLAAHDSAAVRLRAEYLAYTSAEIDYYAALGRQVFGYEPPEIMLLHDNRLNADMINELLALFEQKHYRFVSLDSALSDSAYRSPDTYVTSYGPMWGYRWAAERGVKVDGRLEPDPPDWILRYRRK